jgi:metal-dependent amidase/aminoacylase/carboxypeptidase family protein
MGTSLIPLIVLLSGTKENVIPDEAIIKLNVRTFDEDVRKHVLGAIQRIVNAEAEASRAPKKPEITPLDHYAFVKNDPEATKRTLDAFRSVFPADRLKDTQPTTASEDFGSFGTEWQVPSVFWFVGGTDPEMYSKATKSGTIADLPTNHNPRFAPVIHPTLETGVEALIVASEAWLVA